AGCLSCGSDRNTVWRLPRGGDDAQRTGLAHKRAQCISRIYAATLGSYLPPPVACVKLSLAVCFSPDRTGLAGTDSAIVFIEVFPLYRVRIDRRTCISYLSLADLDTHMA
ncbi:unnamed protein product, partial [Laminaria digitata]